MSRAGTCLAVLALALLAPALASAQSLDTKGVNMRALGERNTAPIAKPRGSTAGMKACPEFGAGFYRLAGSDTCVRLGGGIAADVGVSSDRR